MSTLNSAKTKIVEAVESRQLPIAAVILNQVEQRIDKDMDNLADLRALSHFELFRCGYRQLLPPMFSGS